MVNAIDSTSFRQEDVLASSLGLSDDIWERVLKLCAPDGSIIGYVGVVRETKQVVSLSETSGNAAMQQVEDALAKQEEVKGKAAVQTAPVDPYPSSFIYKNLRKRAYDRGRLLGWAAMVTGATCLSMIFVTVYNGFELNTANLAVVFFSIVSIFGVAEVMRRVFESFEDL